MNQNEEMLLAAIIQHNELFNDLELSHSVFETKAYANAIKYFNSIGSADIAGLYQLIMNNDINHISKDELIKMRNDKFIKKSHFKQYQISVLDDYKKRMISEAARGYAEAPNRENELYLKEIMEQLDTLQIGHTDTKHDTLLEVLDSLTNERSTTVTTGFSSMDSMLKGFEPAQFNVIGARPSVGKTAFALSMGIRMALKNATVHFISIETTEFSVTQRILSSMSKVDLSKFKEPNMMTTEQLESVTESVGLYSELDFHVHNVDRCTPSTVRSIINSSKSDKTNVILIDFIQLMNSDKRNLERRLEVEDISRELKILAKQTNSIIIALSQLSRGVEQRQDKRPTMSDLRESGSVEQDANVIMMLYRDDYYNREKEQSDGVSEIECIVAKNKDGRTGMIPFKFYKQTQEFFG